MDLTPAWTPPPVIADPGRATRARIDRLSAELGSGRRADLGRALRSDFSALARAAHDFGTAEARRVALSNAADWTGRMQLAAGFVADRSADLFTRAISTLGQAAPTAIGPLATEAEGSLRDMMAALNGQQGGRALFGNGDPDGAPLGTPDELLAALRPIAAGALDPDALLLAFDDFFAPGGTFETDHLADFPVDAVAFPTGQGRAIPIAVDLDDPALRFFDSIRPVY